MRDVVVLVALTGCAHTVSEPNPAEPAPPRDVPYGGRIVLVAPELTHDVDPFESAWTSRLAILGVTAHITYDAGRAIVDVYGAKPDALPGIANALVDVGGWTLTTLDAPRRPSAALRGPEKPDLAIPADGALVTWLPAQHRAKVAFDRDRLCTLMPRTDFELVRSGSRIPLTGQIRYHGFVARGAQCPNQQWWPESIVFDLPEGVPAEPILLALAGGSLPSRPAVESIAGRRP